MARKIKKNKYAQISQASLDLHGMTIDEAEFAVEDFLRQSRAQQLNRVRIITGKGINSPNGLARLKPWLEDYLRSKNYQFRSAKINEGGEGAVDVSM